MIKLPIVATCIALVMLVTMPIACAYNNPRLLFGTMQFPHDLDKVPDIRIYYGGHKIKTTTHDDTKQTIFSIPTNTSQDTFHVLITDAIEVNVIKSKEAMGIINTIDYLRVRPAHSYRLFEMKRTSTPANTPTNTKQMIAWTISEQTLTDNDLRIPDMAIVVCYNPHYIETIIGTTKNFALPTIQLKSNVISLAGGSQKLHEQSNALLLASIDMDTLHPLLHESVKQEPHRACALIAAPAA
jgi:hypothetical protein